jgi:hypothetical protein
MSNPKQPSKHAEIKLDGYTIPLIGIAPDATQQECELCHDIFQLQSLELVGTQMLCERCRREGKQ